MALCWEPEQSPGQAIKEKRESGEGIDVTNFGKRCLWEKTVTSHN